MTTSLVEPVPIGQGSQPEVIPAPLTPVAPETGTNPQDNENQKLEPEEIRRQKTDKTVKQLQEALLENNSEQALKKLAEKGVVEVIIGASEKIGADSVLQKEIDSQTEKFLEGNSYPTDKDKTFARIAAAHIIIEQKKAELSNAYEALEIDYEKQRFLQDNKDNPIAQIWLAEQAMEKLGKAQGNREAAMQEQIENLQKQLKLTQEQAASLRNNIPVVAEQAKAAAANPKDLNAMQSFQEGFQKLFKGVGLGWDVAKDRRMQALMVVGLILAPNTLVFIAFLFLLFKMGMASSAGGQAPAEPDAPITTSQDNGKKLTAVDKPKAIISPSSTVPPPSPPLVCD